MKNKFFNGKKFRYGSISISLTIVIVAAVILFNAAFTVLAQKNLWYIDMTPEPRFTLSDEAKGILAELDETKEITVQFCDDRDTWESNTTQREVLTTVLEIAADHKNVKVKFTDVYENPTSVAGYSELTGKSINTQSVVITSGTEVRVFSLAEFFRFDSDQTNITGYNGEQVIVAAMLAVTQMESPLLCYTVNHGEGEALTTNDGMLYLMEQIGFKVKGVDLSKEDLPDDCRLLLVFGPTTDFLEKSESSDVSEIDKLEAYLNGNRSMMVFFNKNTPALPNLENFLYEWGIAIERQNDEPYQVKDTAHSLTNDGYNPIAEYTEGGTGADITEQLRTAKYPKTVVFPNSTALKFSDLYNVQYSENDVHAYYATGSIDRLCYEVFESTTDATALAGGLPVAKADGENYDYMLLSCQTVSDNENNRTLHSFILASASTDFASSAALDSKYGNRTVLAYACNVMGSLSVPVSLDCKYYADTEIASITTKAANQYTVVLTVIPTTLIFAAGVFVIVRRKYA